MKTLPPNSRIPEAPRSQTGLPRQDSGGDPDGSQSHPGPACRQPAACTTPPAPPPPPCCVLDKASGLGVWEAVGIFSPFVLERGEAQCSVWMPRSQFRKWAESLDRLSRPDRASAISGRGSPGQGGAPPVSTTLRSCGQTELGRGEERRGDSPVRGVGLNSDRKLVGTPAGGRVRAVGAGTVLWALRGALLGSLYLCSE